MRIGVVSVKSPPFSARVRLLWRSIIYVSFQLSGTQASHLVKASENARLHLRLLQQRIQPEGHTARTHSTAFGRTSVHMQWMWPRFSQQQHADGKTFDAKQPLFLFFLQSWAYERANSYFRAINVDTWTTANVRQSNAKSVTHFSAPKTATQSIRKSITVRACECFRAPNVTRHSRRIKNWKRTLARISANDHLSAISATGILRAKLCWHCTRPNTRRSTWKRNWTKRWNRNENESFWWQNRSARPKWRRRSMRIRSVTRLSMGISWFWSEFLC